MCSPVKLRLSKLKSKLVNVTPAPVLSRLKGLDNRVVGRMEMPGSVLILRVVATTNMSTGETEAQVNPGITGFQAIFAAVCTGGDLSYLVEMRTLFFHQSFPSFDLPNIV